MSPRLRLIPTFALALSALLLAPVARAQQTVVTSPVPGTTDGGNASSTITATSVFQIVFSAGLLAPPGPARKGCTIQNNGTNIMWVTEGLSAATATKAKALQLAPATATVPGGVYQCSVGGLSLVGEIDITGTIGDAFYAAQY